MNVHVQEVKLYEAQEGRFPFRDWINGVIDPRLRSIVARRVNRVRLGNFGDHRALGEGLFELRIHDGPGIRVYYGRIGNQIVILLCGGDKNQQLKDIHRAHMYWRDYKERCL